MGVTTLVHLLLALPLVTLCSPADQWLHQIYVDSQTGVNDSSCWKGSYSTPCLILDLALTGAQHYNRSTIILLQPGQHQLNNEAQIRNMSQLAIVGNGNQGEVVIRCEPLVGLAFFWSEDIELRNVEFVSCGALQNSKIASEWVKSSSDDLKVQVAILFDNCKAIKLVDVQVNGSNGTGTVLYNPMGVVSIDRCLFFNNALSDEQEAMYGGGGLVIDVTSQFSCTINNSTFSDNIGPSLSALSVHSSEYFGLARGGGISVVFRRAAANNTIHLFDVHLDSNRAQFGGGLFLAFLDNTRGNTVNVDGAEVKGNKALLKTGSVLTPTSSGGGIFIGFADDSSGFPFDNLIIISSSNFTSNIAETGGGITVDVLSNTIGCTISAGNKLVIEKCVFDDNEAFQGASAYMSQRSKSSQTVLDTTVCYSNFTNGHIHSGGTSTTMDLPFYGNILLKAFTLTLEDYILFAGNNVSAISLHLSSIEILPSAQVQFINNNAFNGAAFYIVDCSSVILNNGMAILFERNVAIHRGGAIYAESCALDQTGGRDCIIKHKNTSLHPNDWNVSITFLNNSAFDYGNSIYIDSVRSCLWNKSNVDFSTFCWKGWQFPGSDCRNELSSGPSHTIERDTNKSYSLYPGECFNLTDNLLTVLDNWGHNITNKTTLVVNVLLGTARVIRGDNCQCKYHTEEQCANVDISGWCNRPCDEYNVLLLPDFSIPNYFDDISQLLIHPPLLSGININISFKSCEFQMEGMVIDELKGCSCEPIEYSPVCTLNSTSTCTTCYLRKGPNKTCTTYSNGWGMCGSCNDMGYGVAVNSPYYICAMCDWCSVGIFVSVELVPVLIMMIILAVLHVSIINGNLNGFVLYSQLISTHFPAAGLWYPPWTPVTLFYSPVPWITIL